ncbi:MAG TPA: heme exporter protein CcmD [Caulobacteraceae bacterium]|nr:heme exporter protein CcmD [Caulobacteraceae bacterium]
MMGKYAFYVLTAYGVSAVVIGWMILDTLLRVRRWRAEVQRLEKASGKAEGEA